MKQFVQPHAAGQQGAFIRHAAGVRDVHGLDCTINEDAHNRALRGHDWPRRRLALKGRPLVALAL